MIFETHAHYDDEKFDEDRAELLSSMQENGIGRIINVSANLESLENTRKLMEAYPFIYGAFGLHPDEVGDLNEDVMARMRGDELRRIFGHDDMHVCSGFPKTARHICHFIGGNSACHTKYNTFSVKIFHCNSVLLPRSSFFPMIVLSIADRKTDYNQSCLPLMQKGFIIKVQKNSTFKIIARYFYDFSH
jgi:hypothetical protein